MAEVEQALFGADKRQNLTRGVKFHTKALFVELRNRLLEFGGAAVGGVTVRVGAAGFFHKRLNHKIGRWHIGCADVNADDVLTLGAQSGYALPQLGKKISAKTG